MEKIFLLKIFNDVISALITLKSEFSFVHLTGVANKLFFEYCFNTFISLAPLIKSVVSIAIVFVRQL